MLKSTENPKSTEKLNFTEKPNFTEKKNLNSNSTENQNDIKKLNSTKKTSQILNEEENKTDKLNENNQFKECENGKVLENMCQKTKQKLRRSSVRQKMRKRFLMVFGMRDMKNKKGTSVSFAYKKKERVDDLREIKQRDDMFLMSMG